MKNICFISRDNGYGAGVFTLKMITFYLEKGFKITLFGTQEPDIYNENFVFRRIKIVGGNFIIKEPLFFFYSWFLFFKFQKKFDKFIFPFRHGAISLMNSNKIVTIFHSTHSGALGGHIRAMKYFRDQSIKSIIYHVIGAVGNGFFITFDLYNVIFSGKSIFVDENSMFLKKFFKQRFLILENYYTNSPTMHQVVEKSTRNVVKLCYIGRLDPLKGIGILCEKINKNKEFLLKKIGKFELLIVGDGFLKKQLMKYDFINFIGKVPYAEIGLIYQQSDLILLPSLYENQPIVILDAIKFKIPFFSTPHNSIFRKKSLNLLQSQHFFDLEDFIHYIGNKNYFSPKSDFYGQKTRDKFESQCLKIIYE